MPMISVRKIELGWARAFFNLGKNCDEILKTHRDRSERCADVMIDVGSIEHNGDRLSKPLAKPYAATLRLARVGARDEQLLRSPVT